MKKSLFYPLFILICVVLVSCSKSESFPEATGGGGDGDLITGLVVRARSLQDQIITFQVFDADGNEVTENTTFYVDGTLIGGNTFSSPNEGDFEVYGEYLLAGDLITTDTEPFQVIIPKRKVLLEDYTGAWCGYCPRMAAAIEAVRALTDDVVAVAIHNEDEMAHPQEEILRDAFGVYGFPNGRINRTINWINPHVPEAATTFAGEPTDVAIAIDSKITDNNLEVKVRLVSATPITSDKIVVYLLEDGILSNQTNYYNSDPSSPFYQMGNPIIDFVNHDVLRETYTNILGDVIPETGALVEYFKTYTAAIPSNYNQENLKIVVMIVTDINDARNAQVAPVNSSIDYE